MLVAEGMHNFTEHSQHSEYSHNSQLHSSPKYNTQYHQGASRNLSQTPLMFNGSQSSESVRSSPSRAATSSPASSTSSVGRSDPPKRLRYWLIDMINGGSIPGLHWIDEAKSIFQIPWKHAGKNNWKEDDCKIFKAWAEHRGKYKPGDKVEAATWKTRLRCALNKLPDIKELKDQSMLDGSDPFRVYKLLPEPDKSQEYEIYPRNTWGRESPFQMMPEMSRYVIPISPQQIASPPHYIDPTLHIRPNNDPIPSHEFSRMNVHESTGCFINKLNIVPPQPVQGDLSGYRARSQSDDPLYGMRRDNVTNGVTHIQQEYNNFDAGDAYNCGDTMLQQSLNSLESAPAHHEMEVYIRYRGRTAIRCLVTEKTGCRIHHGDENLPRIATKTHDLPSIVFGSESLQQIPLSDCRPYAMSEHQIQLTEHVLNNITRGLIFYYNADDKCFYAKRLCLSRVFISGPESGSDVPEKLERNSPVKVFDYRNFCEQLKTYSQQRKAKTPDIEIMASFGQSWSIKSPLDKNLVTLTMAPRAARYLIMKTRSHSYADGSFNDDDLHLSSAKTSVDIIAEQVVAASQKWFEELMYDFALEPFSISGMEEQQQEQQHSKQQNDMFQSNDVQLMMPPPMSNDVEMERIN